MSQTTTSRRRRRIDEAQQRQLEAEDTFAAAIQEMPDKYIQCRDIRHLWKVVRDYHLVDAEREQGVSPRMGYSQYVRRLLACTRCGKKRNDAFIVSEDRAWTGLKHLNSTYDDPEGFLVKGAGRMAGRGNMIRGEAWRRVQERLAASG